MFLKLYLYFIYPRMLSALMLCTVARQVPYQAKYPSILSKLACGVARRHAVSSHVRLPPDVF